MTGTITYSYNINNGSNTSITLPQSNFPVTGLNPNTTYTFNLNRNVTINGVTVTDTESTQFTTVNALLSVTKLSTTSSNAIISISDPNADLLTGTITYSYNIPGFITNTSTTLAQSPLMIQGLSPNTSYTFNLIRNVNYNGTNTQDISPLVFTTSPALAPTNNIVCFKEDTKILTPFGYTPIQYLRPGDLVKTLRHDFVPINMIGRREIYHPCNKTDRIKDQLYRCSKYKYPELIEDLVITGCHCILENNFVDTEQKAKAIEINGGDFETDKKCRLPACVDSRTSVYEMPGTHTIYHLALDHDDYFMNYGIYANGLLVESCSKRNLTKFANMELIE